MRPPAPPADADARTAARGVAWGGIETAAAALSGLVITPLLVRSVGIEGLGLWGACWAVAHTAGMADLGVAAGYARFTAQAIARGDGPALERTLAVGVGFYLLLSAALLGAGGYAVPLLAARLAPGETSVTGVATVLWLTLLVVCLRATLSAFRGVVAGAQRLDLLARIGSAAAIVEAAGAAAVLLLGGGLAALAANALLVALLQSGAEMIAARRLCPGLRLRPFRAPAAHWREILSFGATLQSVRLAEIVETHAPRLALAFASGLHAAGAYDLGARLGGVLRVAGALPLPVIQPLATRLEAQGAAARLPGLLERTTRYVALLAAPGFALVVLDAPALLTAWTGREQPPEAAAAARLVGTGVVLALLVSPLRLVLRGLGRAGSEALAAGGAAAVQLVVALSLAAPLGALGVAAAAPLAGATRIAIVASCARRLLPEARGVLGRASAGALLALLCGLAAGLAVHRVVPAGSGRIEALLHLVPETTALVLAGAAAAFVCGAVRAADLRLLREGLGLPERAGGRA